MKKLLCFVLLSSLLLCATLGLSVSALDDDVIITSMVPNEDTDGVEDLVTLNGCTLTYSWGAAIIELTAPTASVNFKMMDVGGSNALLAGSSIDLSKPAYCVVDYGTTGNAAISSMVMHYTRADKQAVGAVADLYLNSMTGSDYKDYQKKYAKDDHGEYVIWDWGTYVSSSDTKLFPDKIHCFTSTEINLTGKVGDKVVFYTVAITSTDDLDGLGEDRPVEETSSEDTTSEETSEVTSEETTEEPSGDTSDVTSEESTASEDSSAASEETSSVASEASSEAASSEAASEASSTTSTATEDGGLPVGAIIGIIVAVVVVIAAVVVILIKRKK